MQSVFYFGIFERKPKLMKQIFFLLILVPILSIASFASNTPEHVMAKLQIKQLPFSKLQAIYPLNDSLEQNLDSYSYYEEEYFNARKRRSGGIFLSTFGLSGFIAGSLVAIENNNEPEKEGIGGVGTGIFITAAVMTGIGIPLWISGSTKMKKNRTILEEIDTKRFSLKLTSTADGLGIAIIF